MENVERHFVGSADHVLVRGSRGDDHIEAQGCHLELRGGAGDDELSAQLNSTCVPDSDFSSIIRGDAGDDFLGGSTGMDLLIGGPGRDSLNGGPGDDDVCRGEVKPHGQH